MHVGVANFRPHRLRDTFAVKLLVAGVAIEDVSALLSHSSVRTTERYHAPWDRSRRDRLVAIVEGVNKEDSLLLELAGGVQQKERGRGRLTALAQMARQQLRQTTEPASKV